MLKKILALISLLLASNAYANEHFALTHLPGAATQATVTQPGAVDKRHVAQSIAVSFVNRHETTDQLVTIEILSGTTRLWATRILVAPVSSKEITLSNMDLPANEGRRLNPTHQQR